MSVELATAAYLYGFPLVADLDQVVRYTSTGAGTNPAAAYNTFSHARSLAGPADTFVTINNDTVYSMAQVDLGVGAVRFTVPDTAGRYVVFQFIDAWTDDFAYVGTRSTGSDAGTFLLVPPDWSGEAGDERVIRFPTRVATVLGRWGCDGADDLPAVHALQDATRLEPLDAAATPAGVPPIARTGDDALDFFERYRVWSQAFAPAPRDAELQASFAPLGLTGATPVAALPAETLDALRAGYRAGAERLDAFQRGGGGGEQNGWQLAFHAFDYNLDFFELGTIDAPEWKIADPQARILGRAAAAAGGLWGNHAYEAAYALVFVDTDSEQLDGAHVYRLRLAPTPPVGAFWSITMYDVPHYFLVDNPIDRYSIGDRTPGTVADADGGITITISHDEPGDPVARANWLPAPPGPFRPALRMYLPGPAVLDGTYVLPGIERVR